MKDSRDRRDLMMSQAKVADAPEVQRLDEGSSYPAGPQAALKSVLLSAVGQLFQSHARPGLDLDAVGPDQPTPAPTPTAARADRPRIHLIPDCLPEAPDAPDVLIPDIRSGDQLP